SVPDSVPVPVPDSVSVSVPVSAPVPRPSLTNKLERAMFGHRSSRGVGSCSPRARIGKVGVGQIDSLAPAPYTRLHSVAGGVLPREAERFSGADGHREATARRGRDA